MAVAHTVGGHIRFEQVSFGYLAHEPVLEEIDLEIQPGEMIGLGGHSGSGKSTLINLMLRLYDVQEGRILLDGVDLRDVSLRDLRSPDGYDTPVGERGGGAPVRRRAAAGGYRPGGAPRGAHR